MISQDGGEKGGGGGAHFQNTSVDELVGEGAFQLP